MADRPDLTGLLDTLRDSFDGDTFTVGDMIEAIQDRGFGPLPFAAAIPAAAIAFLGLGISVRDGLLVALGLGVALVGLTVIGVVQFG